MKTVGLITEYNPFHNGHKYHIEEAKRITGADYVIAVMSGNFVQRGIPAVIDKYSRAEMALQNGIDLVLELPVCYAASSAEFFAHGAVSLLDKLGIVDTICFGSECGDISLLKEAASFLSETPAAFDEQLQAFLKDGLTYPAARLKALLNSMDEINSTNKLKLAKVLCEPNNILGLEYMKAILRLKSSLIPVTIQRKAAHYHDVDLSEAAISSATAIRNAINGSNDITDNFDQIRRNVPDSVYDLLMNNYKKTFPITEEDFSQIIRYKLLSEDNNTLMDYLDISSDLADRLKNFSGDYCSIRELTGELKTKNMTLTRISRALAHILLNIKTEAAQEYNRNGYTRYARVLGIKKESSQLLRKIEIAGQIPIITKVSKASTQLDSLGMRMLSEDIFAAHLYNQAVYEKYGTKILNEYKHGICIM